MIKYHKKMKHEKYHILIPITATMAILTLLFFFMIGWINEYTIRADAMIRSIDSYGELGNINLSAYDNLTSRLAFWSGIAVLATIMVIIVSFTSLKRKGRDVFRLAYYDALTNLPNTDCFKFYWDDGILEEESLHMSKIIYLINTVNFKLINMTSGYRIGDEVIKEIANRLKYHLPNTTDLFRLSADRFILVQDQTVDTLPISEMISLISKAFKEPFKFQDATKKLSIQVSVLTTKDLNCKSDDILRKCLIDMDHLKVSRDQKHLIYNREIEETFYRESLIENELREVIDGRDTERLHLMYQPQHALGSSAVVGVETLARFDSKHLGTIPPQEFITIAENKQLIIQLGKIILKSACDFACKLTEFGHGDIRVAVNVSAIQLLDEHFTDDVVDIVRRSGCKFTQLELEITESAVMDTFESINTKLKYLRDLGILMSLDDFGTGYSSLYRLQSLEIDTVKLDKRFIDDVGIQNEVSMITAEIIKMAHIIGLNVVAEGVETESQAIFLQLNQCDIAQGYLFNKPMKPLDILSMLTIESLTTKEVFDAS